ncbi:MAG: SDR family NAD(P)-dependent oxidoreductase [Pseudomonadota bacterium]|nr:SDR family NAD(P)-dependent oxidoreductase [Pseudomonadota bacterium]
MGPVVWITGASSGLGRQAAIAFARRGYRVAVTARRADELDALARDFSDPVGEIVTFPGDVTDARAMADVVAAIERELGPIGIAVLNAGDYRTLTSTQFTASALRAQYELNVFGSANCVEALLPRMIGRGAGRLYLVASLAGYVGLPRAVAYGSSKAALILMAESMRIELEPLGVVVGVVNPGFVKTPLTAKNDFPMPFLMPVERAAECLVDGVLDGRFEVAFPWTFVTLMKLLRCLPYGLGLPLIRRLTGSRRR